VDEFRPAPWDAWVRFFEQRVHQYVAACVVAGERREDAYGSLAVWALGAASTSRSGVPLGDQSTTLDDVASFVDMSFRDDPCLASFLKAQAIKWAIRYGGWSSLQELLQENAHVVLGSDHELMNHTNLVFHDPHCPWVDAIKPKNLLIFWLSSHGPGCGLRAVRSLSSLRKPETAAEARRYARVSDSSGTVRGPRPERSSGAGLGSTYKLRGWRPLPRFLAPLGMTASALCHPEPSGVGNAHGAEGEGSGPSEVPIGVRAKGHPHELG